MEHPPAGAVFWILALVILVSGLMVVTLRNIFHCALALVLCLFSVAGIYILLHAEFLAAAQVLIYVGAVAILIIFAVMLTTDLASRRIKQNNESIFVALFVCIIFVLSALTLLYQTDIWRYATEELPTDNVTVIGKYLMTEYMLPFEIVSVLLLAALIGAIVLARRERS
jgi:NADH-quinone oxidoreductase subunit J